MEAESHQRTTRALVRSTYLLACYWELVLITNSPQALHLQTRILRGPLASTNLWLPRRSIIVTMCSLGLPRHHSPSPPSPQSESSGIRIIGEVEKDAGCGGAEGYNDFGGGVILKAACAAP